MAPTSDKLKSNYNVTAKFEPFFTGGKIQVTSNGETLLCQCGDQIQVVEAKSGKIIRSLKQDEDEVVTFQLGPDDSVVVSSHKSGLLRHWTWEDGNIVRTWKSLHLTPVVQITFDSTTTLVASGATDGSLRVWDISKRYCTHSLKGGSGVYSLVRFSPDLENLKIYGASMDGKIRVWDLKSSKLVATLEGHFSVVTGLTFYPSQNRAVSSGRDKVLILWDLVKNVALRTVPTYECIESLVGVPFGEPFPNLNIKELNQPHVITAGDRGCLRVWNMNSALEVFTQTNSLASPSTLDGGPSVTQLESISSNGALYMVTFDHNIIVHQISDFSIMKQFAGYNDDILDIAWFGQGENHLAVATNSNHVKVYNLETMDCTLLKGHTDLVMALATSRANLNILVTSSKDNSVRVWRMSHTPFKISCIAVGNGHTGSIGTVALSRTNLTFLVSGSQDTCLKMWRLDPEELAVSDKDSTSLTVLHTAVAHDKDINSVCVSPNDKLIATGSQDKSAKIWDSTDFRLLGVMRGHRRGLWAVQFSPVDQVIASASADGSIKLWSLTDYSCIKTLEGHESSVLRLQFVARGQQIVSAASDGLIKLWTLKTSECTATMDNHECRVWALAAKSDDSVLASGAGDANLILWRDVTKEEQEAVAQEHEKRILEEQKLSNLMQQGLLLDALVLAIRLDQPSRSLNILKELMDQGEDVLVDLEKMVSNLSIAHKDTLLRYASKWNTNSRHCHEAQMVIKIMVANHTPDELFRLPSLKSSLAGLLVYSERHMQRLSRLRQNSAILPYTAAKIQATSQNEIMDLD